MGQQQAFFWWAYGYKTRHDAEQALQDAYAEAEASPGDGMQVRPYKTPKGTRYGLTCPM